MYDPHQELGVAIIQQAVDDMRVGKCRTEEQEDAHKFIFSKRLDRLINEYGLTVEPGAIRKGLNAYR